MKNMNYHTKYHTVHTTIERGTIYTPNTLIHHHSWHGTSTSIKSDEVKLGLSIY